MKCARCYSSLQPSDLQGSEFVGLESCSSCGGTWFDKGVLDRLDKSVWTNADELEFRSMGGDREWLACPRCRVGMELISPSDVHDLVVDRCPVCEGFWLDAGELEKMQDLLDIRKPLRERPPDWSHLRWIIYSFKNRTG